MPFDPRKPIGNAKHSTLFSFFWTWSIYGVLFGTPSVFIAVNESIHPLNLQSFLRHYIIAFENIINFFQIIFEPISILIIRIFELININLEYSDHWVPIFLIASLAFGCIIRGILAITKKYEEIKFVIYAYVLCFIGCFILGFSKSFDNIFWQGFVSLAPFGLISIPALILIFLYHVLSRTALDRNLTLRNARIEISIKKRAPELRRAYEVLSEDIQSTFTRFKHDKRAIPPIKEEELSETDILKKMERNISPIYSESMKLYFYNRDSYIDHIRRKHLFIFESFKNKHEKQMNEFDVIKKIINL